jgi:cbb3-type cytochrome oxidase subunit 3
MDASIFWTIAFTVIPVAGIFLVLATSRKK